jgi:hypothetical protein
LLLAIARGWIVSGGLPLRFLPSNRLFHRLNGLGFDAKKRSAAAASSLYVRWTAEERAMATDLEIRKLIHFETASDGTAVRLIIEDSMGDPTGIIMPIDILTALLMTLPAMASSAVKRANDDPSVRITYPLREFQIELSPDNLRILTIGTPDGFTVSFSLTEELPQELGEAHLKGIGARAKTH